MLVKCKCHSVKIDRDIAFKVVVNSKNEYYCSELEYLELKEKKEIRKILLEKINEVFGYIITNTILNKELSELSKVYSFKKINSYVSENMIELQKFMSRSFTSEYGKIKYFTTILKNNLKDYIVANSEIIKESTEQEVIITKYKPRNRKKSLDEYISDLE